MINALRYVKQHAMKGERRGEEGREDRESQTPSHHSSSFSLLIYFSVTSHSFHGSSLVPFLCVSLISPVVLLLLSEALVSPPLFVPLLVPFLLDKIDSDVISTKVREKGERANNERGSMKRNEGSRPLETMK